VSAANGTIRRTRYDGFVTTHFAADATKTTQRVNHLGWTVRTEAYTGTSEPYALYAWTVTERFDPRGQPRRIRQNDHPHAAVEITYDALGRKTQLVDPDSGPPGAPGVWRYAYDKAGRLIAQDDPTTGQSLHFCYDAEGRITQKLTAPADTLGPADCATVPAGWARVLYEYDTLTANAIDRLHRVTEADDVDGTEWTYDARGRVASQTITVDGRPATFTFPQYDPQDRPLSVGYPDCETVTTRYDAAGQPVGLTGSDAYVHDARYDVFGRVTALTHTTDPARQVVEDYRYHGASADPKSHRLERLKVTGPSGTYLNLVYPAYTPRGFLLEINDAKYNANSDPRSSDATFTYDALGRLTAVTSARPGVSETFSYDALGNMRTSNGVAYTYAATKPHQVSRIGTTALAYGPNGTLDVGRNGQGYGYDAEGRLTAALVGNTPLAVTFDAGGAKVKSDANGTVTRYYADLVEVTGSEMTKVYFFGGRRVASNRVAAPAALAGIVAPAVDVAGDPDGERLVLVVTLRPDVQVALAAVVLLGTAGLLAWPGKRRARVVGMRLRAGTVVLVLVATGAGTLPVPWLVAPAWAGGYGPPPCLAGEVQHYHVDHLGSVQVLTGFRGEVVEHLRYRAYGAIRHRSTAAEASLTGHRFTAYELEPTTGLYDAGARFYDPQLAIFLTHDPAREFANPYTYTNWNPVNLTDPSGMCVWDFCIGEAITAFAIGFGVGFTVSAIQAGVNGASFGEALKAGAIGGAIGGVTGVGLGVVGAGVAALNNPGVTMAFNLATMGSGVYSTVEGFRTGQYVLGAAGVVMLAHGMGDMVRASEQRTIEGVIAQGREFGMRIEPARRAGQGLGDAIATGAKVLAADLAATAVGIAAKPAVIAHDLWRLGQSIGSFTPGAIAASALALGVDAAIPTYGFYGGGGWGTGWPWGAGGWPAPLNRVDWASFHHDQSFDHFRWVQDVWSVHGRGLPPGPIGQLYGIIGTPPFVVAGAMRVGQ